MALFGSATKKLPIVCVYVQKEKDLEVLHENRIYFTTALTSHLGSTGSTRVANDQQHYFIQAFELAGGGELGVFRLNEHNPTTARLENCIDGYMYTLEDVPKKSPVTSATISTALREIELRLRLEVNNLPPTYPFLRTALID